MLYILKTFSELRAIRQEKNRGRTTRRRENIEANVKRPLKIEVQSDLEDVENSEFRCVFGENFCFKAPQLSEKSSRRYVSHIENILQTQRYLWEKELGSYDT